MISACIIAKNEDLYLGRLLDSLTGYPEHLEVIVLDTGSTDGTVALASRYQGVRVANFVWTGSFSDARNAVADLATNDWVLWLDADMYFEPEELQKILELMMRIPPQIDAISLKVVDPGGTFPSPRIYRKHLRFEGAVHEHFEAKSTMSTPFRIMHQRDEDPAARAVKDAAYTKVLEAELEANPESVHARMYLRDLAIHEKNWDLAESYCHDLLAIEPEVDYLNYLDLSFSAYNNRDLKQALKYGVRALEYCPTDPRVYLAIGDAFEGLGKKIEALTLYKCVLSMPPESKLIASKYSIEEDAYNVIPYTNMASVYASVGKKDVALDCLRIAIDSNPKTKHRKEIEKSIESLAPPIVPENEPKFVVISTAYKVSEEDIMLCLHSVANQEYHNFHHFYVAADESTLALARQVKNVYSQAKLTVIDGRGRTAIENLKSVWSDLDDNAVVLCVDGDDGLACPDAFQAVAREYLNGAWVTYGQLVWRSSLTVPEHITGTGHDPSVGAENPRRQPWVYSHLKTFYAGLAKRIRASDLHKPDGSWVTVAADLAIMYAVIELAGAKRCHYIPKILYNFNDKHAQNSKTPEEKAQADAEVARIRGLPSYDQLPEDVREGSDASEAEISGNCTLERIRQRAQKSRSGWKSPAPSK